MQERHRRLHLLLDAYGYDDDRSALRAAMATRARRNAEVTRRLADGGGPRRTPHPGDGSHRRAGHGDRVSGRHPPEVLTGCDRDRDRIG
ncbi:hypothetical protein SAMN05660642_00318 [Geodermatophilus siccatus]|uniref:Uncharacterized protein n=1 Tax=Geodermatophilus siccatus TaxID=1137991 RepID=A0A1G9L7J7_9ACTN|nr:hypothetical protein [Geodermatophilus siccatus]SDL57958.1 hypothetical protein SAMN05660642_00318 [Geodermatophilus siccatus]